MSRTTNPSDTRLVRRSQEGDRRAFRALLTRYDWRLRGLAYALLLDPAKVDAALHTAYVRAWREVVRIDARVDAAAWLYRVAYNCCVDALRRESTRIGAVPPAMAPGAADGAPDPEPAADAGGAGSVNGDGTGAGGSEGDRDAGGGDDVSAVTPAADVSPGDVVAALARLAPADRVAVVLVDREGFTSETAARILGLAPEVLAIRLAAARATLAQQLAPTTPDAAPPVPPADEPDGSDQLGARVGTGGPATPSPNGTAAAGTNGPEDGEGGGS